MNKTVNINLAGTFFHIDEDAYLKLQRYLDVIKRSFTSEQGRDEIIADVEARIAELFAEKIQHDRQVIGMKEVEEVIRIMGQPEDYLVDEAIFENPSKAHNNPSYGKTNKRLYRDTENKYIGGVCAGMSYYLGVDVLWIRLLFILFTIFSGFGLLAYILFWILVPEAATNAQKLEMRGEPVNLSNIEKKVKEGLDNVAESIKNIDYEKVGKKARSAWAAFFDAIAEIITLIVKIFAKAIGIILIIVTASTLIALFIALFTVGTFDFMTTPWSDFIVVVNTTGLPMWLLSLIIFTAVGIPFFFLFYLGLKILVTNLKSMGRIAKYTLLGLWLIALMALISIGVREFSEHAYNESVTQTQPLPFRTADTLTITMAELKNKDGRFYNHSEFDILTDENDTKKIYSEKVRLTIKPSQDTIPYIKIRKEAEGNNYKNARERAANILYQYATEGDTLLLDNFLTTGYENKYRNQEVYLTLYIPAGATIKLDSSLRGHIRSSITTNRQYYNSKITNHLWKMNDAGKLECLDCLNDESDTDNSFNADEDGVNIDMGKHNNKSYQMTIDKNGIQIKKTR